MREGRKEEEMEEGKKHENGGSVGEELLREMGLMEAIDGRREEAIVVGAELLLL